MTTQATIYHNPRCSKSRITLDLIKQKNQEVEIVEYLKTIPTKNELKELINKLIKKKLNTKQQNELQVKNFKTLDYQIK